jgi:hypothetical protein
MNPVLVNPEDTSPSIALAPFSVIRRTLENPGESGVSQPSPVRYGQKEHHISRGVRFQ